MSDTNLWRSGEECPESGQWQMVDRHGDGLGIERTMVKGETFPPTLEEGQGYRLADPTKHLSAESLLRDAVLLLLDVMSTADRSAHTARVDRLVADANKALGKIDHD